MILQIDGRLDEEFRQLVVHRRAAGNEVVKDAVVIEIDTVRELQTEEQERSLDLSRVIVAEIEVHPDGEFGVLADAVVGIVVVGEEVESLVEVNTEADMQVPLE